HTRPTPTMSSLSLHDALPILRHLERHKATGCVWLNYYNLKFRKWRRIRNSCAALCNTAFRRECLPMLADAAREAIDLGIYHVDRLFWRRVGPDGLHEDETVIGLKEIGRASCRERE